MSDTDDRVRRDWHEEQTERVAWEVEQFRDRGLPVGHSVGADNGRFAGRFVIRTELLFKGKPVPVEVVFPFDYPDEPPTAFGPPGLLDRHQHPVSGNFCLLEDPDRDWWPADSAAQLIDEDLRWLLEDSEKGPEALAAGEADMSEPVTAHFTCDPGEVVVVPDPFWQPELPARSGEMTLQPMSGGEGFLLERVDGVGIADSSLVGRFASSHKAPRLGTWVELPEPPEVEGSVEDIVTAVEDAGADVFRRARRALRRSRARTSAQSWLGLTFPEQGPTREQQRRAWLFVKLEQQRDGTRRLLGFVRAHALTAAERALRLPELVGLSDAQFLVIGAGSLGGPVALEFAKAGAGGIEIVDNDFYDVNNAVRHVIRVRSAGLDKAFAVAFECEELNPFTKANAHHMAVGGSKADNPQLDALIEAADVVIDATGAQYVARILQRRCREAGTTLIVCGLTAGSYGGEIVVLKPDQACLYCFALRQRDGSLPTPPAGPRSNVTPIACRHPAFSGAGFEATELAAIAARSAVRATRKVSYPPLDYDWAVSSFRSEPHWQQGRLARHPNCPRCD